MHAPFLRPTGRACLCLLARTMPNDKAFLRLVQQTALAGLPRAQAYLDHFLAGTGRPLTFATADLLAMEPRLRQVAMQALVAGQTEVPVSQLTWTNRDWAWALGSVRLHVDPVPDGVWVGVTGVYRWHPEEARLSQAVHQAAARLVARGEAQPFAFQGSSTWVRQREMSAGASFSLHAALPVWQQLWGPV